MAQLWPAGWAPARSPAGPPPDSRLEAAPLILTVALPDALQRQADGIRNAGWPQAARHAPAHLTLFRHLPGLQQQPLLHTLRTLAAGPAPRFHLDPPARWGDRWAAPVRSPGLDNVRAELAERWHGLLAPGDIARPRLHISLSQAREAPPALPPGPWAPGGLLLWRHSRPLPGPTMQRDGAFWTPLVAVAFRR